jgi:hypothetical protein
MKPPKRTAKKKTAMVPGPVADRVNKLTNKGQADINKRSDAVIEREKKDLDVLKERASKLKPFYYNYERPLGQEEAYQAKRRTNNPNSGSAITNAMVGKEMRGDGAQLGGDPTSKGKLVKASKKAALANKNRSKQAIDSDKRRFKKMY